jgi:hypothetical protein
MMKKLTEDLKRMLDGLASQDAGEFLSMDEKLQYVIRDSQPEKPVAGQATAPQSRAAARRIAVVINKGSTDAAFRHALQASQRLGTHLDLLLCGPVSRERVVQLEAAAQRAGVAFSSVYLSGPVARGIADYTGQHFSLIYVVAPVDDPDMAEMIEETLPARRRYLPVPLVLVGNKPSQPVAAASAM